MTSKNVGMKGSLNRTVKRGFISTRAAILGCAALTASPFPKMIVLNQRKYSLKAKYLSTILTLYIKIKMHKRPSS